VSAPDQSAPTRAGKLALRDVMRPGVITCPPEASLTAIATTMVTYGIHSVIVASPADTPLIVTDFELVRAARERPDVRASELAREPAATLPIDATLDDAVEVMTVRSISHVVAVDPAAGALAGVVSSLDVAAAIAGVEPRVVRMLSPSPPRPTSSAHDLAQAQVRDVMHHGVTACAADEPLSTVALVMADYRVHCVAVAGIAGGRSPHLIWGLIDDTGLVAGVHRRALAQPVSEIADPAPIAVRETESLDRATALMVEHQRRHLVVVGDSGIPSGIVSTLDVAEILSAGIRRR